MEKNGKLRLELVNVYGERLREKVDIMLRHLTLSDSRIVKNADASRRIAITQLQAAPQGLYRLEVDPPSYLPMSRFVNISSSGFTDLQIPFAVDPKKVKSVLFPGYQELPVLLRNLLENSSDVFFIPEQDRKGIV